MFIGIDFNSAQTVALMDLLHDDSREDDFKAGMQLASADDHIIVVPRKFITTPGRKHYHLNEDGTIDERGSE